MIVRYSSLNRFEKPKFTLCNPGSVYTNDMLSKVVGPLVDTEAEEIVLNFNATSEFNFRVNRIAREDPEENAFAYSVYKAVQNRRLIFADDIGYFMITNIEDGFDGHMHYKDVTAKSIDAEIAQKMLPFIADGTYRFLTDATGENKGLLNAVVETLPLWTIGHVDETVAERWRTFEDVSTSLNCLAFMLQNMQDAYECIFVFNNITRTINVYDQANYVRQTNIHITKEDLINSLDITENADDLFTAVSVLGDDNVTISAINPLGTNVIYDFTHYLSWMSESLRNKVAAWQNAIATEQDRYYNLNLNYFSKMTEVYNFQMEIEKIDTQITMYNRCRNNIVADYNADIVDSYNDAIAAAGGARIEIKDSVEETLAEIDRLIAECESHKDDRQAELTAKQAEIDSLRGQIDAIRTQLSITSFFTEEEYTELCHYIFEGSYSDDYVVITDVMSYDEKFAQMKILYDRASAQLRRASQPTKEFSVDVENFIFIKEFEEWSEQLETGCLINVELDIDDIAALFLSNMIINYDDHLLKMTFGNRFNKFDPKSLYENVLGKISKSANTLSYIKEILYPIKNGEFDAMKEALQTSRDLTMGQALASTNEEIVIDGCGYTGRRLMSNGEYDPRQVKIVCNSMVFTNDGWDSCEVAIGEILLGDGSSVYGVNAKAIMGQFIIGEHLNIVNESGSLSFGNDGLTITNGINSFRVNPNSNKLLAISNSTEDVFYVDSNGVLHISGDGAGLDISANAQITGLSARLTLANDAITAEVKRAIDVENGLDGRLDAAELKITPEAIVATVRSSSEYKADIASFQINEDSIVSTVRSSEAYQDDLKAKANQTDVDGLSTRVSTIEQTSGSISLRVETLENSTPSKLTNSSIVIDTNGIAMSGGNIAIESGVKFLVNSGGTVQISAGSGAGSFINLGEAFSASSNGVSATSGNFAALKVGGKNVLTEDSLASKIVVSKTEPSGGGIIWLCPSSVNNVSYKGYTGDARTTELNISRLTKTFAVTCESSDTLPNSTYKYTVKFPIYLTQDGSKESNVKFSVVATKASDSSKSVKFPDYTIATINAWEEHNISITVESTTNLCANTGAINIAITASNVSSTNLFVNKESYVDFIASDTNATGSTQPCSVYYKP